MNEFLGIPIFDKRYLQDVVPFFPQHHILEYYYSGVYTIPQAEGKTSCSPIT